VSLYTGKSQSGGEEGIGLKLAGDLTAAGEIAMTGRRNCNMTIDYLREMIESLAMDFEDPSSVGRVLLWVGSAGAILYVALAAFLILAQD